MESDPSQLGNTTVTTTNVVMSADTNLQLTTAAAEPLLAIPEQKSQTKKSIDQLHSDKNNRQLVSTSTKQSKRHAMQQQLDQQIPQSVHLVPGYHAQASALAHKNQINLSLKNGAVTSTNGLGLGGVIGSSAVSNRIGNTVGETQKIVKVVKKTEIGANGSISSSNANKNVKKDFGGGGVVSCKDASKNKEGGTPRRGTNQIQKGALGNSKMNLASKKPQIIGNYQIQEIIGRGAHGRVYRASHLKTKELVAIKMLPLSRLKSAASQAATTGQQQLPLEIDVLKKLDHNNIVKYRESIQSAHQLCIILEYADGGSLEGIIKKFGCLSETIAAVYIRQVLIGLDYLHKQGVIHRDIKGGNILTTRKGVVKLADFGVATMIEDQEKQNSFAGTPYWVAPEVIEMSGQVTSASDIWSVGCTLIELLQGKPPNFDLNPFSAMIKIVREEMPIPGNISPDLASFLNTCLIKEPTLRPPASTLLQHPWLVNQKNQLSKLSQILEQSKLPEQVSNTIRVHLRKQDDDDGKKKDANNSSAGFQEINAFSANEESDHPNQYVSKKDALKTQIMTKLLTKQANNGVGAISNAKSLESLPAQKQQQQVDLNFLQDRQSSRDHFQIKKLDNLQKRGVMSSHEIYISQEQTTSEGEQPIPTDRANNQRVSQKMQQNKQESNQEKVHIILNRKVEQSQTQTANLLTKTTTPIIKKNVEMEPNSSRQNPPPAVVLSAPKLVVTQQHHLQQQNNRSVTPVPMLKLKNNKQNENNLLRQPKIDGQQDVINRANKTSKNEKLGQQQPGQRPQSTNQMSVALIQRSQTTLDQYSKSNEKERKDLKEAKLEQNAKEGVVAEIQQPNVHVQQIQASSVLARAVNAAQKKLAANRLVSISSDNQKLSQNEIHDNNTVDRITDSCQPPSQLGISQTFDLHKQTNQLAKVQAVVVSTQQHHEPTKSMQTDFVRHTPIGFKLNEGEEEQHHQARLNSTMDNAPEQLRLRHHQTSLVSALAATASSGGFPTTKMGQNNSQKQVLPEFASSTTNNQDDQEGQEVIAGNRLSQWNKQVDHPQAGQEESNVPLNAKHALAAVSQTNLKSHAQHKSQNFFQQPQHYLPHQHHQQQQSHQSSTSQLPTNPTANMLSFSAKSRLASQLRLKSPLNTIDHGGNLQNNILPTGQQMMQSHKYVPTDRSQRIFGQNQHKFHTGQQQQLMTTEKRDESELGDLEDDNTSIGHFLSKLSLERKPSNYTAFSGEGFASFPEKTNSRNHHQQKNLLQSQMKSMDRRILQQPQQKGANHTGSQQMQHPSITNQRLFVGQRGGSSSNDWGVHLQNQATDDNVGAYANMPINQNLLHQESNRTTNRHVMLSNLAENIREAILNFELISLGYPVQKELSLRGNIEVIDQILKAITQHIEQIEEEEEEAQSTNLKEAICQNIGILNIIFLVESVESSPEFYPLAHNALTLINQLCEGNTSLMMQFFQVGLLQVLINIAQKRDDNNNHHRELKVEVAYFVGQIFQSSRSLIGQYYLANRGYLIQLYFLQQTPLVDNLDLVTIAIDSLLVLFEECFLHSQALQKQLTKQQKSQEKKLSHTRTLTNNSGSQQHSTQLENRLEDLSGRNNSGGGSSMITENQLAEILCRAGFLPNLVKLIPQFAAFGSQQEKEGEESSQSKNGILYLERIFNILQNMLLTGGSLFQLTFVKNEIQGFEIETNQFGLFQAIENFLSQQEQFSNKNQDVTLILIKRFVKLVQGLLNGKQEHGSQQTELINQIVIKNLQKAGICTLSGQIFKYLIKNFDQSNLTTIYETLKLLTCLGKISNKMQDQFEKTDGNLFIDHEDIDIKFDPQIAQTLSDFIAILTDSQICTNITRSKRLKLILLTMQVIKEFVSLDSVALRTQLLQSQTHLRLIALCERDNNLDFYKGTTEFQKQDQISDEERLQIVNKILDIFVIWMQQEDQSALILQQVLVENQILNSLFIQVIQPKGFMKASSLLKFLNSFTKLLLVSDPIVAQIIQETHLCTSLVQLLKHLASLLNQKVYSQNMWASSLQFDQQHHFSQLAEQMVKELLEIMQILAQNQEREFALKQQLAEILQDLTNIVTSNNLTISLTQIQTLIDSIGAGTLQHQELSPNLHQLQRDYLEGFDSSLHAAIEDHSGLTGGQEERGIANNEDSLQSGIDNFDEDCTPQATTQPKGHKIENSQPSNYMSYPHFNDLIDEQKQIDRRRVQNLKDKNSLRMQSGENILVQKSGKNSQMALKRDAEAQNLVGGKNLSIKRQKQSNSIEPVFEQSHKNSQKLFLQKQVFQNEYHMLGNHTSKKLKGPLKSKKFFQNDPNNASRFSSKDDIRSQTKTYQLSSIHHQPTSQQNQIEENQFNVKLLNPQDPKNVPLIRQIGTPEAKDFSHDLSQMFPIKQVYTNQARNAMRTISPHSMDQIPFASSRNKQEQSYSYQQNKLERGGGNIHTKMGKNESNIQQNSQKPFNNLLLQQQVATAIAQKNFKIAISKKGQHVENISNK